MTLRLACKQNLYDQFQITKSYIVERHYNANYYKPRLINTSVKDFGSCFKPAKRLISVDIPKMNLIFSTDQKGILYRVATKNDSEVILDLLRKFFFPEEPLIYNKRH